MKRARRGEVSTMHYMVLLLAVVIVALGVTFLISHDSPPVITGFATSQVGNLSANIATYISCTWSNDALAISFGSNLNPGTYDINATQNFNLTTFNNTFYNVTVDTFSNVAANITVKGENLVSGGNVIGVTNITWASNGTNANGTNMISSNGIVLNTTFNIGNAVGVARGVGSTTHFRFWVDIPNGTVAGSYTGNYTMQCSGAT
jgi:hypothetical protein